jgi:uncharacterized glyoxalase superfamily protein PhnB
MVVVVEQWDTPRQIRPRPSSPKAILSDPRSSPMPTDPPINWPRISPYLLYEDVARAIAWLSSAFGFEVRSKMPMPDGTIVHAELEFAGGVILVGYPGPQYRNPERLGQATQSQYIYVQDVNAHCARATAAPGIQILEQPNDQPYGDRRYGVADPEGHQWYFAQRLG